MTGTFCRQLKALNKKNLIMFKRNKRAIIWEFLIPALIVGMLSAIVVPISNGTVNPQQSYIDMGVYAEKGNESPFIGINMYKTSDSRIALVGDGFGSQILSDIYSDKKLNYTQDFKTFTDVRNEIMKYKSQYDSHIRWVSSLDVNDEKTDFQFNLMSTQFSSGFIPFNAEQQSPATFNQYKYVDYNSYVAGHASLIFEKFFDEQQNPVNISLGYVQRSSFEYKGGNLVDVMDQIFPLFAVIVYTLPFMYILQRAVEEKQSKVRESMRMMGMIDSAYFTSWFIVYFFQVLIVSIIMTLGSAFTLFPGGNFLIIFLMYFMYGMSIFGM